MFNVKAKWQKLLLGIGILILTVTAGFFIYVSDHYRADALAAEMLKDPSVRVGSGHIVISSPAATDTALIFYPGAKVEYTAYLPSLREISRLGGIDVILVKMPFNLAIFDAAAADGLMAQYPAISTWYIGGHSLGGAMASDYASNNQDKIQGLILLAAYRYGTYPTRRTLTVYGELDTSVARQVDYSENVVIIAGGNHANFGNYGAQRGDPPAAITARAQQAITADAVAAFINRSREGND